ncbi:DUF6332 family protein [Streptomyces sp. NBC_01351]|uniref:DUF6332 family protein n=1 Tax=Streptomyces sp. NBC_01351 TaxID=2903833 RepID=UPI002E3640AE|nr:DUF6332 family protein [Streptomyces sp. NBC_01351]
MGRRTRADQDAITIEIGYALVSAGFAAAFAFGAVYGPSLAFSLSPEADHVLAVAGGCVAAAVFLARVAHVLWRFTGGPEDDGRR